MTPPLGRLLKPGDDGEDRRLPAAGMPDDADELRFVNPNVDVLDRDEQSGIGREDFGKTCGLEGNDDAHAPAFSTATDEKAGGGAGRFGAEPEREACK